jgi:hypothetical protein
VARGARDRRLDDTEGHVVTDLSPTSLVRSMLRVVRPQVGAVVNAGEAIEADRRAALQRRESAVSQARASGPFAWTPLEHPLSPVRSGSGHAVFLYDDDAELVARLASYVADGVACGEVCLVVATEAHLAGLRQRLVITGLADVLDSGLLVEFDAAALLRSFMYDDWPDPDLFELSVGSVVRSRLADGVAVRAFGEMVGLLTEQGNLPAALQLEKLWDGLQLQHRFALLCAYPASAAALEEQDDRERVLARHSHLAVVAG